ncbi:AAA family ATPase [Leptolyngbya sp. FACHB-711]|uniref:AAA family ATPase n=1 Tax=unclassified Leptolyngbya TaxID=2650499 RepID=UPI00168654E0|nr:AAA family ATPase [Leptolyngbya sp. FACHB-711]MBD2025113.1 AAA family ATPase [Leptolyngbya sp. FACHB-711]
MKLVSMKLFNFRQFWGEVEINLAGQPGRSVTVIHGNNGAGKTTLLNAFTWVLYGQHTGAFASPEQHINKRAIAQTASGKRVDCWVEVVFEHNSNRYRARRSCYIEKSHSGELPIEQGGELALQINGKLVQPPEVPEDKVGQVLPESLHRYFFFDGERIDRIVKSENKSEISKAIRTLLSVEVLDRAINHLKEAYRSLNKELAELGDPETKRLVKEKEDLIEEKAQLEAGREEIASELEAFEEQKQKVTAQLRDLDKVGQIQERRDDLKRQEEEIQAQLDRSEDKLRRTISARGYMVFLTDAIAQFRNLADELRQRGELPAGIKQQFVEDLLEDGACICGTQLEQGTKARKQVESWLDRSGIQQVEEAVIQMGGEVNSIERQIPEFWAEVEQEQASIENLRRHLSTLENQLDDIREQLKGSEDVNVSGLEKRLEEIEDRIIDLHREDENVARDIEECEGEIGDLNKQIKDLKAKSKQQALIQRQMKATDDAIDRLTQVRSRVDSKFRVVLEQKVREIFRQVSFKTQVPKLTENYELVLVENLTDGESIAAPSTGENQILSLSFIGSIIERVRYWSKKHSLIGLDSSSFPIVMDSPFGTLDENYRRQIAKLIPMLADQLVVLATKTQWRGEVETEMEPYIDKEYVLVFNSAKPDCEPEAIVLNGETYPLVRQSPNEFEWTEVVEVERR